MGHRPAMDTDPAHQQHPAMLSQTSVSVNHEDLLDV